MKKSKGLVALVGAVVLAFGVSALAPKVHAEEKKAAPAAAPAEKKEAAPMAEKKAPAPKEMTVKGKVAKGKAEGSWVIKAGKKTYQVDPASPKAADVAGLDGKSVQAKGMVTGKMISVAEVTEVAAKAKAEAKPAEKPAEKK